MAAPHRGRAAGRADRGRAADPRGDEAGDPAPRGALPCFRDPARAGPMTLLALEPVHKSYWRGRHGVVVLDDVSCEIRPGELVGVFGQRASGKTTLLSI